MTAQETSEGARIALHPNGQVAIRWPGDDVWHITSHGRPMLASRHTRHALPEEWVPVTAALEPEQRRLRPAGELLAELADFRPWLASLLPTDVLETLHTELARAFDEQTAGDLTYAIELAVASRRSRTPWTVARLLRTEQPVIDALARELSATTGLRWRSWSRGFYLVTYDGVRIGVIDPVPLDPIPARIRRWQPHAAYDYGGPPGPTTRTVKAAAEALYDFYRDRTAREAAETRRQRGVAADAITTTRG